MSSGDGSAKPTSQPASPKAEAQNQDTKTRQMKEPVLVAKPLTTPWSAIVKASRDEGQSGEAKASTPSNTEGKSNKPVSINGEASKAETATKAPAAAPKSAPASGDAAERGRATKAAESSSKQGDAPKAAKTSVDKPRQASEGGNSPQPATAPSGEPKSSKPAWKVPTAAPVAAPMVESAVAWPSLGDSKGPLPKKKQRQQQQPVVPAPPPPPAATSSERPKSKKDRSGRAPPAATDSATATPLGGGGGEKEVAAAGAGSAAGAGDREGGGREGAGRGPSRGGGTSVTNGANGRGRGNGRNNRSGANGQDANTISSAPAPPPPSGVPTGPTAAAPAPQQQQHAAGGEQRGRGEGRQSRNTSRGGQRGGSAYGARTGMGPGGGGGGMAPAYGQPVPASMVYGLAAPVFYPPAAYGVSPAVVGMAGTPVDKLQEAVRAQIEYYFSLNNLVKDVFLRAKMNGQGWIPLHLVASFNRVRMLTPDPHVILASLGGSNVVEISSDQLYMRPKHQWDRWVLAEEQRDPTAHAVPPVPPAMKKEKKEKGAAAASVAAAAQAQKVESAVANAAVAVATSIATPAADAPATTQAAAHAPAREGGDDEEHGEDDMFQLDEEHDSSARRTGGGRPSAPGSTLTDAEVSKLIVVKPSLRSPIKAPQSVDASGAAEMATIINDGLELYARELHKTAKSGGPRASASAAVPARPPRAPSATRALNANFYPASLPKGGSRPRASGANKIGASPPSVSVGWVLGSTPPDSLGGFGGTSYGSMGTSPLGRSRISASPRAASSLGSGSLPLSKFQHPSYSLLEDNGFTEMKYEKFYARCIAERSESGVGLSDEMNTLFRFWCYFLRDHYNQKMYEDFKQYALEDSDGGYQYGVECLFRFYSYGLEKEFREGLYRDFEMLVLRDYTAGHLYGLEKFWAFHHYTGLPKGSDIVVQPELQRLLDSDFKSLGDFKAKAANFKPHDNVALGKKAVAYAAGSGGLGAAVANGKGYGKNSKTPSAAAGLANGAVSIPTAVAAASEA